MEFKRYQHLERYGKSAVRDIELGVCYIFPKLDGTNASIWLNNNGEIRCGSRNRELTLEKDNAGFYRAMLENEKIKKYLKEHPTHRLYGEWLVPHTIKTYRDDAWKRFYIFDVCIDKEDGSVEYIPYDIYSKWMEEFELDYISPLKIITNGSYDEFIHELENNNFMIQDGMGTGEGVVIKNYDFYNQHQRQIWAKIVSSEFKERNIKAMGCPEKTCKMIEEEIVNRYVTTALIEKEYAKIVVDNEGWHRQFISQLLNRIFYELITEETWNFVKEFKNPTINFKVLNALTTKKIKEVKSDIFG